MIPILLAVMFLTTPATVEYTETIWVGGDKGIRQVQIVYVDAISNCGDIIADDIRGCYFSQRDVIIIQAGYENVYASTGCTIKEHELLHAFGLMHGRDMPPNCTNPHHDDDWGTYNPDIHPDPIYIHKPVEPVMPTIYINYLNYEYYKDLGMVD